MLMVFFSLLALGFLAKLVAALGVGLDDDDACTGGGFGRGSPLIDLANFAPEEGKLTGPLNDNVTPEMGDGDGCVGKDAE